MRGGAIAAPNMELYIGNRVSSVDISHLGDDLGAVRADATECLECLKIVDQGRIAPA